MRPCHQFEERNLEPWQNLGHLEIPMETWQSSGQQLSEMQLITVLESLFRYNILTFEFSLPLLSGSCI